MELIPNNLNIDFIGKRKLWLSISIGLILVGLLSIAVRGGLRFGVDFQGGTMVQVAFNKDVRIDELRAAISGGELGKPMVQEFVGKQREFVIQLEETTGDIGMVQTKVKSALERTFGSGSTSITQTKMVGPKVGSEIRKQGFYAIIATMLGIMCYVWLRFEFFYGVGGVVALLHDVLITLGFLSVMNKEIDMNIVAALLTIVGFSINDTVVVYDRIRENSKRYGPKADLGWVMNKSVNETMSRTILTTGTAIISTIVLLLLGGGVIHDFALTLFVGFVVGTFSSVYIASPIVLIFHNRSLAKQQAASAT